MSDNLAPLFSGTRALRRPQVLALSGPDAVAFAQAQFANDVPSLADGHWHWNAWLTAKGRVLAVFQLLRLDAGQLLLLCHDGGVEAMAEQLRRFVFRRKVTLAHADAFAVEAAFQAPARAHGAAFAHLDGGAIELDLGTAAHPRTLRLVPAGTAAYVDAAELAWRQWDLRFGLPRLEASQQEQWTPQQLGLDRLAAYSVKKGCYPGQEIVARTHFLGKAKRSLALLHGDLASTPGDAVTQAGATLGTVASSAGTLALAVLPLDLPAGGLEVAGAAVERLELLDGLAR
ncbi:MAG: folate-binding protein YgfZ [Stenotrophomonas sp.]|uniref:CAF17-like 4Fe-4S cluster assembly/insertion protein YgfZ n=1 Tax=Stenotrophomonas sp. TaxID=69392 RepID=UPI0013561149|nr:folate-binding protein [Stenotrophomonas sp.]MTI74633.1 folate-binding protein YgfZ [Stenotrophomonas sp.]